MTDRDTRRPRAWRKPVWALAGAFAVALLAIGIVALFLRGNDDPFAGTSAVSTTLPQVTTILPPVNTTAGAATTTTTIGATTTTMLAPSASGAVAWERAPEQESLEGAAIVSVVVYDGRLFAGGYVVEDGTLYDESGWLADGAVWVSDDGLTWERTGFPTFDEDGTEEVATLVAGPDHLLALGYRYGVGGSMAARPMIWVSADGRAWEEMSGGIPDSALVYDAIWTEYGWVAVGWDRTEGVGAMAWVSEDGLTWTRATVTDTLRDDQGYLTTMYSVTDTGSGLVAVGDDEAGEHAYLVEGYTRCAAAWFSETGRSWDRIAAPDLCGEEEYLDSIVTDGRGGVLAQGGFFLWAADDPADPRSWHTVSESKPLPSAAIGDTAVGLGIWDRLPSESDDGGATWTEVDGSEAFDGDFLLAADVVAFDGRFVVVGEDPIYDGLPGRAAVWVGTTGEE